MITTNDLIDYAKTFPEVQQDAVIIAITKDRDLREVLSTEGGQMILSGLIKKVNENIGKIISLSVENGDVAEIKQAGFEICLNVELIKDWAKILIVGEHHANKLHKIGESQ